MIFSQGENSKMSEIMDSTIRYRGLNRSIPLLLGGFAIVYNLSIALHELGHTILYPIVGERMIEYVLNPFSWSWATGEKYNVFVLWGGVTLGQFFSLIPLLLTHKIRSTLFVFLSRLLAACSFLINGIYLSMGAVFGFGDGGDLAFLGMNATFIITLGILYILIALVFWSDLQHHLGMDSHTAIGQRIKVIMGGIAPYMMVIFFYNLIHNSGQITMWGGLAGAGLLAALLISVSGHLWSRRVRKSNGLDNVSRHYALHVLVAGLLVILAEFIIFGMPPNPF
jgi:hypothetical protein